MRSANKGKIILADWGNSSLRFYLANRQGEILEKKPEMPDGGIRNLALFDKIEKPETIGDPKDLDTITYYKNKAALYAKETQIRIGDWLSANPMAPIVMCGVIGSREGWSVAPYLPTPIHISTLSEDLYKIPQNHMGVLKGRDAYIISGLKTIHTATPLYDNDEEISGDLEHVMRSEETKAVGVYNMFPTQKTRIICMPGTHSQWVQMRGDQIETFWQFRTGEMYANMTKTGSIATIVPTHHEPRAHSISFLKGLKVASSGWGLLTGTMGVRAGAVIGANPEVNPKDYLSGMLIGQEVADGLKIFGRGLPVTLVINEGTKADRYIKAFEVNGGKIRRIINADEVSLKGLQHIAGILMERLESGRRPTRARRGQATQPQVIDATHAITTPPHP